jgi:hypothetical protein
MAAAVASQDAIDATEVATHALQEPELDSPRMGEETRGS